MSLDSNLFLMGYRGTGKSTVARHLAVLRGWEFVDSDDQIEQQAGQSIAQIFKEEGEPAFRDREERVVQKLCEGEGRVVALGGGAVLRAATRKRMGMAGKIVWLQAGPATLAQRIGADASTAERRPSLTSRGLLEEIKQLLAEREPIYQECATLVVDTEKKTALQVAEEIDARLPKSG